MKQWQFTLLGPIVLYFVAVFIAGQFFDPFGSIFSRVMSLVFGGISAAAMYLLYFYLPNFWKAKSNQGGEV